MGMDEVELTRIDGRGVRKGCTGFDDIDDFGKDSRPLSVELLVRQKAYQVR